MVAVQADGLCGSFLDDVNALNAPSFLDDHMFNGAGLWVDLSDNVFNGAGLWLDLSDHGFNGASLMGLKSRA